MGEEFNLEIINPDKSFLNKKDVTEVVVPALEGEMGILKDHISIISFLKPGIIKVYSKSGEDRSVFPSYSSAIFINSCILLFSKSLTFIIKLVRTDKLLFLNSKIPSSI